MKKYSIEWKQAQQEKRGGWAQYHRESKSWKWHYIQHSTEHRRGDYLTKADCEAQNA